MYWFASLVNAQQNALIKNAQPELDTRAMRLAISNYQTLYNSGAIDPNCAYQCLMAKFSNAELPYFVNGIWAYQHLKHKLQDDLAHLTTAFVGKAAFILFCLFACIGFSEPSAQH